MDDKPVLPPLCGSNCLDGCFCQRQRNHPSVYNINRHLWELGLNTRVLPNEGDFVVTAEDYQKGKCFKSACAQKATHLAYDRCMEKLLCDDHAKICKEKNRDVPNDLWFCKAIK